MCSFVYRFSLVNGKGSQVDDTNVSKGNGQVFESRPDTGWIEESRDKALRNIVIEKGQRCIGEKTGKNPMNTGFKVGGPWLKLKIIGISESWGQIVLLGKLVGRIEGSGRAPF